MKCELDPTAEGCVVETDTTLWACSESMVNGAPVAEIYKLSCKAQNGSVTSCNGKTNVDIPTDGQLVKAMAGTCAQNGYENGVQSGGGAQDSTGASADCFAITGSTCHFKDKVTGNTFRCECDGDCDAGLRQLYQGNCQNPYEDTTQTDSVSFDSSASSSPSSSGSGESSPSSSGSGESSPSSGGSGGEGGDSSDFEYDYRPWLDALVNSAEDIRANTQYTGDGVSRLNNKADKANEFLQQIADKDLSVNVQAPNVTLNADTARAPAAILGLLTDKMNGGEPNAADTAGTGAQLGGLLGQIDSLVNEGVPDMRDSLGGGVQAFRGAYDALKDTMAGSAWADSVSKWEGTLLDNGVISGSGSDACPAVLSRTWEVPLGVTTATIGPIGKYLCAAVPNTGVTFWALARVLLRAVVSIGCMIWLFKAVMGIDGGSSEED